MMKETLMYSLQATALGMAVVFGFLFMLEMIISFIKKCFERNAGPTSKSERQKPSTPREAESKAGAVSPGEDEWLAITVGIFMLEEDDGEECSARSWAPFNDEKSRLWILSKE
jgi:Na+-transporting methylmalonyl-CoA/oxaloacetate decarboxylase gamma subunit